MIPRAQTASDFTTFYGRFRMYNTNEIQKLKIGDYLCDRSGITFNENTPFSSPDYLNII